MTSARGSHRYIEGGFPNVTLLDVEMRECGSCGVRSLKIPRQADLHQLLASTMGGATTRTTALKYSFRFDPEHEVWLWSVEGAERPPHLRRPPS